MCQVMPTFFPNVLLVRHMDSLVTRPMHGPEPNNFVRCAIFPMEKRGTITISDNACNGILEAPLPLKEYLVETLQSLMQIFLNLVLPFYQHCANQVKRFVTF